MRLTRRHGRLGALIGATGLAVAMFATGTTGAIAEQDVMTGQEDADALREAAGSTGAIIVTRDGDSIEEFGSGTTDSGDDIVPDGNDQFRVASNTKMFVSTVLLQLADEGQLDLDSAIGEHLPGLVEGDGIDESQITVRQLLQHTSGLAENLTLDVIVDPTLQWFPPDPVQMTELGLRHGAEFEPEDDFLYSNTGYTVLGLLIEELTGQDVGDAIDERVSQPLGLQETSYAYAGMKEMSEPHFRGYIGVPPLLLDVSEREPGLWAGAGALVSSGSDMTTFADALVGGQLLSDSMLDEMQTTFGDTGYGLGIGESELSCGAAWGHSGHVPGYMSFTFADGEGKSVFAAFNATTFNADEVTEQVTGIVDSALCGPDSDGSATLSDALSAAIDDAQEQGEAIRDQDGDKE